jgi:hypothetical protein
LESENERECDCDCDNEEKSGKVGDAIRLAWLACDRESEGVPTLCLTGVTNEVEVVEDKLLVRWRDEKVEMAGFDEVDDIGPDTDLLEDTLDRRLFDLLWVSDEPDTTSLGLGCAGERKWLRAAGPRADGFTDSFE